MDEEPHPHNRKEPPPRTRRRPTGAVLSAARMRAADARTIAEGASGRTLMENAGAAVAATACARYPDARRILIFAGGGNNGGDGYAAARLLLPSGRAVEIAALKRPESLPPDAAEQYRLARDAGVPVHLLDTADPDRLATLLDRADLIIDAILGTGVAKRPLQGWWRTVVEAINRRPAPVLAVDICSGIHADSGEVLGCAIRADATLPIAACKPGHLRGAGADFAGELLPPASIGIRAETIRWAMEADEDDLADPRGK